MHGGGDGMKGLDGRDERDGRRWGPDGRSSKIRREISVKVDLYLTDGGCDWRGRDKGR